MERSFGYVRVSSKEQNEARQLIALDRVHVPKENIFVDKQSGKDFKRPMYQKMLQIIASGDTVYVKSIDRLGRDYQEIIRQWQIITREKEADIVVLDMPLLDTRQGKDLVGTFVSDLVLQILSFVSENERQNILSRQREGIDAALQRGVRFGRPRCSRPDNFDEILHSYKCGELSGREAADKCGISHSTFYRWLNSMHN